MVGLTVVAVVRGDSANPAPAADFKVFPGDTLVVAGSPEKVAKAFAFYRTGDAHRRARRRTTRGVGVHLGEDLIVLGVLLLIAYVLGRLGKLVGFPAIPIYMLVGLLASPHTGWFPLNFESATTSSSSRSSG